LRNIFMEWASYTTGCFAEAWVNMKSFIKNTVVLLVMALVAGCGGNDAFTASPGSTAGGTTGGTTGGSTSTTVRIGSGSGAGFTAGVLALGVSSLSAGGSTSVTANLVDENGNPYSTSTDVTFTSTCVSQNSATLTSPVTTTTGTAVSTYVSIGCSGTDTITATATAGGGTISASANITVLAATLGSIQFVSATPTTIALKGTGGAGLSETSTVVFKVLNNVGGAAPNTDVTFSLDTSVGGLAISPASAKTDASGLAQTVVQAGTIPTPVRVTATVVGTNPVIATQSDQLAISTGIPTERNISLSIETLNPETWSIDGVSDKVTARLADRFNNPVPDGTAVSFTAEGGSIGGSCTTVDGACSVNWVSQNSRPADGRVTIMASASGEESFIDTNGNGTFDDPDYFPGPPITAITKANPGVITTSVPHTLRAGNTVTISGIVGMTELNGLTYFVGSVPTSTTLTLIDSTGAPVDTSGFSAYSSGGIVGAFDLPEAYRDDNENGQHDSGEFFVDDNHNGVYDVADGKFNGILCTHTTLCGASTKLIVWDQQVLVMSDSYANIVFTNPVPPSTTINVSGGAKTVSFTVGDFAHNQPMPKGTTIAIASDNGKLSGPSSYTVGNTTANGPQTYGITVATDGTSSTGTLSVTVTAPSGTKTYNTITVQD
jgi:hypothetical protein